LAGARNRFASWSPRPDDDVRSRRLKHGRPTTIEIAETDLQCASGRIFRHAPVGEMGFMSRTRCVTANSWKRPKEAFALAGDEERNEELRQTLEACLRQCNAGTTWRKWVDRMRIVREHSVLGS